jgi:xanthine dehydrogenase accessory factor
MEPRDLLAAGAPLVLAEVSATRGSAPREPGAWMLVAAEAVAGTIGGGQLEYMAIDRARVLLRRGLTTETMEVPLGPSIGQCCGGHVRLTLTPVDKWTSHMLDARIHAEEAAQPEVLVFGAGHVGRALAAMLTLLPVRVRLIDQRVAELALSAPDVPTTLSPLPEAEVAAARPGSAFVILTHDHALDFLVAGAALDRGDAAYVGMIGSETKLARFRSWHRRTGAAKDSAAGLTCPIGGPSGDKRPAVIAALVAAEIIGRLGSPQTAQPERAENDVTTN